MCMHIRLSGYAGALLSLQKTVTVLVSGHASDAKLEVLVTLYQDM